MPTLRSLNVADKFILKEYTTKKLYTDVFTLLFRDAASNCHD